jgi:hypothetical protein
MPRAKKKPVEQGQTQGTDAQAQSTQANATAAGNTGNGQNQGQKKKGGRPKGSKNKTPQAKSGTGNVNLSQANYQGESIPVHLSGALAGIFAQLAQPNLNPQQNEQRIMRQIGGSLRGYLAVQFRGMSQGQSQSQGNKAKQGQTAKV